MERTASSLENNAVMGNAGKQEKPDVSSWKLKSVPIPSYSIFEEETVLDKDNNELQAIASTWLNWQCHMVSGVIFGALFLPESSEQLGEPVAQWPESCGNLALLSGVAEITLSKKTSTIRPNHPYGAKKGQTCELLACPLLIDDKLVAVVSLVLSPRSQPQCHAVLQLLEWGVYWLESLFRQEVSARKHSAEAILKLLSSLFRHATSKAAMLEVTNFMADHLGCKRVSIGLRSGLSVRLKALSHVSHFDNNSQLIREIEAAMDEAVDQSTCLTYPPSAESSLSVVQAHVRLARQGKAAICTIPLPGRESTIGAITCERESDHLFDDDSLERCEMIVRLVGPIIDRMVQDERPLMAKGTAALRLSLGRLLGLGYLKLKLAVLSFIVVLAGLSMIQGEHQVKAAATLQGKVRQLLVAPQNGYVSKGMVTAGDFVDKGELLATLDDRTLQLERQKWQSEKNKLKKEYQQAFSKRDRAQLAILQAQIDKVTAEIQLTDDKITRMALRAPFDGVVVSGDLSQAQGAPVELGQVLFEMAPLDNYRVMLEVDEHDIGELKPGQTGKLVMAALPQTTFSLTLEKVIPVAISSNGYNYFRVEGRLENPSPLLRPGMRGVAKITIQQRDLLWVWSHTVVDRLRLWAWSLGVAG